MSKEKFTDPLENNHFEFPEHLLKQVGECTNGGFILFLINGQAEPEVHASFDHPIAEMGLRAYATKFLNGINSVEQSEITEILHKDNSDEEDSD